MASLFLTIKEAAALIGMTEGALRAHIWRGTGPPARKMSARKIILRRDDLLKWAENLGRVEYAPRPPRRAPKRSLLKPLPRRTEAR